MVRNVMSRRAFMKAAACASLGFVLPHSQAIANSKSGVSLKGMITNDAVPARVNPLNCDWLQIQYGAHAWDYNKVYNAKWALHLFDVVPDPVDVAKAMLHKSYDNWWMLGHNEPELSGITPAQYAQVVTLQRNAVTQADPQAKFCVSAGTWLHPMYETNSWFQQMWPLLSGAMKKRTLAIDTHFYVQGNPEIPQADWFKAYPISDYLEHCRAWMALPHSDCEWLPTLGRDSAVSRELWLTEIGLYNDAYVLAHGLEADQYLRKVENIADKFAARWAWYSMSSNNGYRQLWDEDVLPIGRVFASL